MNRTFICKQRKLVSPLAVCAFLLKNDFFLLMPFISGCFFVCFLYQEIANKREYVNRILQQYNFPCSLGT